jgi:PTH1 family peptidyl-tRNA hydrolase
MKLIVGLGNPGNIYSDSRHNIGFSVVKSIAKSYKTSLKKERGILSRSVKIKIGEQDTILAIPLTYMNLSGIAVEGLLKKYKISLDGLLVVCDDLDLEFGRLKLRPFGSSAGHRGIKSVIHSTGSSEFARLRIGIGRPTQNIYASDYVLSPFIKKEKGQLKEIIERASLCCHMWVTKGVIETMNIYNKSVSNVSVNSTRSILKRSEGERK